uniref:Interleukin-18 n=1 Tax=Anabas testudineus TaxID=64144 RepID=A0A3Q1H3V1_ANATE
MICPCHTFSLCPCLWVWFLFLFIAHSPATRYMDFLHSHSFHLYCKFTVQIYQDSALEQKKGRAVILYTKKEDDNILVCCNEKNEICPVKMELPKEINESQHKAVFYLTELSASQVCTFESSLCRGQFLGFEDDKDKHSLKKLVLHPRDCDQVDDASEIIMNS